MKQGKPEYLNEKEVSNITKLALSTLRNYRCQGKGPAYIKKNRAVRYNINDVIDFMESGRVEVEDE